VSCGRAMGVRPPVAACALSLALVGSICTSVADAGERAEAPVVAPYAPADAPPVSLAGVALAHAAELRTAVRLDIWTASYPADAVRLRAGGPDADVPRLAEQGSTTWCARAEADVLLADGRTVTRSAYFYPPAPPAHGALPDVAASGALTDECRLGLLWVESVHLQPEQDAQPADADVAAATEALSGVLGAATTTDLHWWGSARWRRKALWQHVELIAAAGGTRDPWNRNRDLAFVIMAGPAADLRAPGWDLTEPLPRPWEKYERAARQRLTEALAILAAGSAADIADEMRTLAALADSITARQGEGDGYPPGSRDELATAVGEGFAAWSGVVPTLPADQRAAMLLAMDLLLTRADGPVGLGHPDDTALRHTLELAGAAFDYSTLADWHVYTRTWLQRAAEVAGGGRASELAFLTLLGMGLETSGTCRDTGPFSFLEVIRRGDEYLGSTQRSSIRSGVHLALARAWSDIVALGMGMGYDWGDDADQFVEQAPHARARAVVHYRLAFDAADGDDLVRLAWSEAWRMLAGLDPAQTWFYCIYD
jgi:hypothetical protein